MEMDTPHFHLHFPMCSHTFPSLPLIFPSLMGAGFPSFLFRSGRGGAWPLRGAGSSAEGQDVGGGIGMENGW